MKRLLIIFAILLMANTACAEYKFAENWTKSDTAYETVVIMLIGMDMAQTRWMARQDWKWDGNEYHERNPIFPTQPHQDALWLLPVGMIIHTLISMALPPEAHVFDYKINPRRIWQVFWIGAEVECIATNFSGGVKMEF